MNDLSAKFPDVAVRLRKQIRAQRLESSRKHTEEAAGQKSAAMDIKNIDRLKALGYL